MQAGMAATQQLPLPRTSFVGRERQLGQIAELLAAGHVVTLTGPGGSGKTRLALEAARRHAGSFPDGSLLVELAGLGSPDLVGSAVASAVGIRGRAGMELSGEIADAIGDRAPLLVLDNCEHLVDACAELTESLVTRCHGLRVLATSRVPLRIGGERVIGVPPLHIDDEALPLFVDRARSANAGFVLDRFNRNDIEAICRRLDGIPLAIELAATWAAVMTPTELLPLLDRRFEMLQGGPRGAADRQRTLRAAVDWSHELLGAGERVLFRRLSVFAGGFTREAAERVCSDDSLAPPAVLPTLAALCTASMVVADAPSSGVTRYRLLETIRAYGLERLRLAGEEAACHARHLGHLTARAERAYEERMHGGPRSVVEMLEADRDNVRSALEWGQDHDPDTAVGLAATLVEDIRRCLFGFGEMGRILDRLLAAVPAESPRRARALFSAGYMALIASEDQKASGLLQESCRLFELFGDRWGQAWVHLALGNAAWLVEDTTRALSEFARAEDLQTETGNRFGRYRVQVRRAMAKACAPELEAEARAELEAAVAEGAELADPFGEGIARGWLGLMDLATGTPDLARPRLVESFRVLSRSGDPVMAVPLSGLGACSAQLDPERALRLLGAGEALWRQSGLRKHPAIRRMIDAGLARARGALDPARADRAFGAGLAMPFDELAALVLSEAEPPGRVGGRPFRLGDLTDREAQIAELVAAGLTNRQMAESLVLSVRTVETHVDRILTKLGFHSRSRLAAWLHEQRPHGEGTYAPEPRPHGEDT